MKLQLKAAFAIFTFGVASLIITVAAYDYYAHKASIKENIKITRSIAVKAAVHIDSNLKDRINIALTLASAPVILDALHSSNKEFERLPADERHHLIDTLNRRWMDTDDLNDPFILSHTTNPVATYLNKQQALFPGTYGEIFLTNRYGVTVATTGKLTTLNQAQKYWWIAAHDQGRGRIFLDDRGFDASVQGYVLGIVVPVSSKGEIIGILKCNINILGPLYTIIKYFTKVTHGELKIARSGGLVVTQLETPPLSTWLPEEISHQLHTKQTGTAMVEAEGKKLLVAYTPIPISLGSDTIAFGGSYKSIDHIMGNKGEGWHAVVTYDETEATRAIHKVTGNLIVMGGFMVVAMALMALILSKKMASPIERLVMSADAIGQGRLDTRIELDSQDEIGSLARAFNRMAKNLKATTASRDELSHEIEHRIRAEHEKEKTIRELQEAMAEIKTLRGLFPICAHCKKIRDEKGYWNRIESYIEKHSDAKFSHGLCESCSDELYGEQQWYKNFKNRKKRDKENEDT